MTKATRTKLPKGPSSLETWFRNAWNNCGTRAFGVTEWRFHPTRNWRFDVAWPALRVAVELHGGTNTGGRHVRGYGIREDCRKVNAATVRGWRVLTYTEADTDDPVRVVRQVEELLGMVERLGGRE